MGFGTMRLVFCTWVGMLNEISRKQVFLRYDHGAWTMASGLELGDCSPIDVGKLMHCYVILSRIVLWS